MTCADCGEIKAENQPISGAEWRVFSDDTKSRDKARTGPMNNIFTEFDLTQRDRRDEKEFLWDGHKNIDHILSKLYLGEIPHKIKSRAQELFQKSFKVQTEQKKGTKEMKKGQKLVRFFQVLLFFFKKSINFEKQTSDQFKQKRQRYSRRKQVSFEIILIIFLFFKTYFFHLKVCGDLYSSSFKRKFC